jgi:hypothetical protein
LNGAGLVAFYGRKKQKYWWYKFMWDGSLIRKSTKQTNKRVAEQMEAAHKTALAKVEVGIRERKPATRRSESLPKLISFPSSSLRSQQTRRR